MIRLAVVLVMAMASLCSAQVNLLPAPNKFSTWSYKFFVGLGQPSIDASNGRFTAVNRSPTRLAYVEVLSPPVTLLPGRGREDPKRVTFLAKVAHGTRRVKNESAWVSVHADVGATLRLRAVSYQDTACAITAVVTPQAPPTPYVQLKWRVRIPPLHTWSLGSVSAHMAWGPAVEMSGNEYRVAVEVSATEPFPVGVLWGPRLPSPIQLAGWYGPGLLINPHGLVFLATPVPQIGSSNKALISAIWSGHWQAVSVIPASLGWSLGG